MANIRYIANVLNQKGAPAIFEDTLANRPAAGYIGRIFISTDTFVIQRDNGTTWDSLGGGGGGITGSGAAGQITFWTGVSAVSGDNGLFWDNTNKRLGINTITPGVRLDIHGTGVVAQFNGTTTNNAYLDFQNAGTSQFRIGNTYNGGNRLFQVIDQVATRNNILINSSGQFGINMPTTSFLGINSAAELHYTTNQFISRYFSYSTGGLGVQLAALYTRSNTPGTFGATLNNDVLAGFSGQGSTATGFTNISGYIRFVQNGTVGVTYAPVKFEIYCDNGTGAAGYLAAFNDTGFATMSGRFNVNNATDNALFELNNNGNLYTGGLSPTILTVAVNTTMARTVTGYYCTATLTLTLLPAASLNNVYWVIAGTGATVTVNRAGSDDILNLSGTSVTSITISPNQRAMFYVGGGTRTFLISQA